jgi:hypothetical protein
VSQAQYYRTIVRSTPAYVQRFRASNPERTQPALLADVESRLTRLGAQNVLTVMQDPTSETQFTVISQWRGAAPAAGSPPLKDDVLQVASMQPVEAPPAALTKQGTKIPWDSGLLPDEVTMCENALLTERNPRHLHGIAATMEPYFPAAASILDAKGDLVEKKVLMDRSASRELERAVVQCAMSPAQLTRIHQERDKLFAFCQRAQIPEMVAREHVKRHASMLIDPNARPDNAFPAGMALASLLPRTIQFQGRPMRIVCPFALREALPPDVEDGALNETAVQLALGSQKPKMAMIASEQQIPGRLKQLTGVGNIPLNPTRPLSVGERKMLRAHANMERAKQAIERRRWVDWYRRRERAYSGVGA